MEVADKANMPQVGAIGDMEEIEVDMEEIEVDMEVEIGAPPGVIGSK